MALQGTLKDFSLSDIFQLIGLQRKTGTLTLANDTESVTITFLEGQVVGADTRLRSLEDLLGRVLVRTGRITEERLHEALRIQRQTLQRLGHILVHEGFISAEELRDALQTQMTQVLYRLFRWREGTYRFTPLETVDYDREHVVPLSAETILMEGARMVDEWPILERRIRSAQMVFQKTPAAVALEGPVRSIVDADIDFRDSRGEEEIRLSAEEREVLRLVDGRASVQEIVDRVSLAEFDVYRVLYELLSRHLIEEVHASRAPSRFQRSLAQRVLGGGIALALALACAASVLGLRAAPWHPWRAGYAAEAARLELVASRARLERLDRALRVFYLDRAALPDRLEVLARHGFVSAEALRDPWGRPYRYRYSRGAGRYRLEGLGADGQPRPDLVLERHLSPAQRVVVDGVGSP